MKTIKSLLLVAAVAGASVINAQDSDISISTTFGVESEYIFRGQQLAHTTYSPSIDLSYQGAYAGIWSAFPVRDSESSSKEFDFYAGYSAPVSDMVSIDAGLTYYYYPSLEDVDPTADDATVEAYLGASFDAIVSPSIYLFYDFDLEILTLEASGGYTYAIDDNTSLDLSAFIGYADGDDATFADGSDSYLYGGVSIDVGYAFTDNASASVGVRLSASDLDIEQDSFAWWGASFTAGF